MVSSIPLDYVILSWCKKMKRTGSYPQIPDSDTETAKIIYGSEVPTKKAVVLNTNVFDFVIECEMSDIHLE